MTPAWFEMVMKHSCLMAYELNKSALFVEPCDGRVQPWPQQGSKAARQQGSKAARQQGSKAARQQGSKAARQQGSKAARQRSERKKLRQRK
ncbi:hypothetical protein [Aeromonas sp. FDAARGOS 1408]|uniref:hypothetical protein n=1 Tax=Aeromonas sp. FDAARGOS 1408 TaxID=2778057 RepID=UPI001C212554|nr:hypothetical protein [Aeromonas sp. FDAARGOS 1408]QXC09714.1 hypothetical protein I6L38_07130 [Aeromonas sp. FDAARGOS 1408]